MKEFDWHSWGLRDPVGVTDEVQSVACGSGGPVG